ncbi:hypothetical protein GCM10009624_33380 [Gordonia sinesedis]
MRLLPRRRRSRVVLAVAGTVAVVTALVLIAYLTPLMSVRSTEIRDNRVVSGDQVLDAAAVAPGTPLLQVDAAAVARRVVAAIPSVESARVQRSYPSTLTITVTERRPVAVVQAGDKVHVLDRSGVSYLKYDGKVGTDAVPVQFRKLPVLDTPNPGPFDPTTRAALAATAGLPPRIAGQVQRVSATSPVDIEFALTDQRTVVWGDSDRGAEKARTLGYLLTRKASTYNVSSPEFPAYR